MIINKIGAGFEYEGKKYYIGQEVVGTSASEYDGLFGVITEIRTGADKDTENETPDIYCEFEAPVLPAEVKALEARFSELYEEPKSLEDIILDMVIMAPEMIEPLSKDDESARLEIFVLEEDWAVDGECGHSTMIFSSMMAAKREFNRKLAEEMETGSLSNWEDKDGSCTDIGENSFESWEDGRYNDNHYCIAITTSSVILSSQTVEAYGRLYKYNHYLEDVETQIESWDDFCDLTPARQQAFIYGFDLAEKLKNALDKNDGYWESYWLSVSEVASTELKKFRSENGIPENSDAEVDAE